MNLTRASNRFAVWLYRRLDGRYVFSGADSHVASPRVLEDPEREAVWREQILARYPRVRKLEEKAGRTIPVAVLVPVS